MTVPMTPPAGGIRHRRALVALAVVFIVGAFLLIGFALSSSGTPQINCSNADEVISEETANITSFTPKATPGTEGKPWRAKLQTAKDRKKVAEVVKVKCVAGDAPNPPNPRPCNGVVYMAYKAPPGSNQFGPWPPGLQINGPGDAQKVGQVYAKAFDSDTMQLAAVLQPTYMGGEAYGAEGVQGKAEFFKANSAERKHARDIVKGKLSRASFTLAQTNVRYNTQEAIPGPDACVSPEVHDTTSGGLKWKLTVHLAPQDVVPGDDGEYTVVVNCFWQLHQTIVVAAPKPKPTPRPKPAPTPQTPPAPKPKPKPPVSPPKPPVTQPKTPYEEDPPPPSF